MSDLTYNMYVCPKCHRSDLIEVVVSVCRKIIQSTDGNDSTMETDYASNGDEEWDEKSPMSCGHCGHLSVAGDFDREFNVLDPDVDIRTLTEEEAIEELAKRRASETMDQDPIEIEQDIAAHIRIWEYIAPDIRALEAEFMDRWEEKVHIVP